MVQNLGGLSCDRPSTLIYGATGLVQSLSRCSVFLPILWSHVILVHDGMFVFSAAYALGLNEIDSMVMRVEGSLATISLFKDQSGDQVRAPLRLCLWSYE